MILALDTVGELSGLALWDGTIVAETVWRSDRRQTAEVLPRLARMLAETGRSLADLQGLAVVVGPGSFNGIRVGISTAQGLALARQLPVAGVTAFAAMVWPYRALGPVGTVVRAGRDYALAVYAAGAEQLPPRIITAAEVARWLADCRLVVSAVGPLPGVVVPVVSGVAAQPRPAVVAVLGEERLARGEAGPLEPLYLRPPQITPPKAAFSSPA
ncbi:MAG: tRNA (adenosine(37)-N6)-threonylcarbamoyltransferase complex dimerization subunit type 1 TsaB [Dehalococcoidia bacterium]|nr:MAG: tRNA (adenosine(37)-N6)-threonylcarbamoyltransferase complex dimerization subunit type 1 TsaB [Dehalococcoidia bacterium]